MDGLRGPMILHNPNETYKYDEDVIVTVSGKSLKDLAKIPVLTIHSHFCSCQIGTMIKARTTWIPF